MTVDNPESVRCPSCGVLAGTPCTDLDTTVTVNGITRRAVHADRYAAGREPGMSLHLVPVTFADACGFVALWHRHHQPPIGHRFSTGVADAAGVLRGVVIVGRPTARSFDNGATLEVTRAATDGSANVGSMLYAAAWRAASAMGFRRLITYTQAGEGGGSLRAAGYRVLAERPPRAGWSCPSRPREDRGVDGIARTLWEVA